MADTEVKNSAVEEDEDETALEPVMPGAAAEENEPAQKPEAPAKKGKSRLSRLVFILAAICLLLAAALVCTCVVISNLSSANARALEAVTELTAQNESLRTQLAEVAPASGYSGAQISHQPTDDSAEMGSTDKTLFWVSASGSKFSFTWEKLNAETGAWEALELAEIDADNPDGFLYNTAMGIKIGTYDYTDSKLISYDMQPAAAGQYRCCVTENETGNEMYTYPVTLTVTEIPESYEAPATETAEEPEA